MTNLETTTAVQELFANPEFKTQFAQWQALGAKHEQLSGNLFNSMVSRRQNDDVALNETKETVEYLLDQVEDIANETLRDEAADIYFLDEEFEVFKSKRATAKSEEAARESLFEIADGAGIGQFAMYGLGRYVTGSGHKITLQNTAVYVATTEQRLTEFTQILASYAGERVLSIELGAVWASRLTAGEASMQNDFLQIPTERAHGIALIDYQEHDSPLMFEQDYIDVNARYFVEGTDAIIHTERVIEPAWLFGEVGRPKLLIGQIPEGPVDLSKLRNQNDINYYMDLAARVQTVTELVA